MGCTESILSELAARSNAKTRPTIGNQPKNQPAMIRGDKNDIHNAQERRRRELASRHAERQERAKTISENAMTEKERLSNSTWMSWRSGNHSNTISPAVSITIQTSDGTPSMDNYPNPAVAYENKETATAQENDKDKDASASDMQIRTIALPNQVMETPVEIASDNADENSKLLEVKATEKDVRGYDDKNKINCKITEVVHDGKDRTIKDRSTVEERNGTEENELDKTTENTKKCKLTKVSDDMMEDGEKGISRKDNDKEEIIRTKKKKAKIRHKEVTFMDEAEDNDADSGRKSTSQGR